jgi:hypothetical protein
MLSAIGAWLAGNGASLLLGFVAKLINDAMSRSQADANAKSVGSLTITAKVNQEAADADRRVTKATINAPDVGGVLDDLDRGKL